MVEELDFDFLENPDVDVDVVVATGYWNTGCSLDLHDLCWCYCLPVVGGLGVERERTDEGRTLQRSRDRKYYKVR